METIWHLRTNVRLESEAVCDSTKRNSTPAYRQPCSVLARKRQPVSLTSERRASTTWASLKKRDTAMKETQAAIRQLSL